MEIKVRRHGGFRSETIEALRPLEKRDAVVYLIVEHRLSVQWSCNCIGLSRAAYYRVPVSASIADQDVIKSLNALVERHPRWGFWKCFKALRRLGQPWNNKRVYRIYCSLRLNHGCVS